METTSDGGTGCSLLIRSADDVKAWDKSNFSASSGEPDKGGNQMLGFPLSEE